MNTLMKFVALASVAVMAGCVGSIFDDDDDDDFPFGNKDRDRNDDNSFVARAGTLPSNFTNRAVGIIKAGSNQNTQRGQLTTVANEYRESVLGESSIVDSTGWYFISGDEGDSLKPESGFLMVYSEFVGEGNIAVGIFSTTDVGPAFTATNPTATFDGFYTVKVISTLLARDYEERGAPITLTADFGAKTLGGTGNSDSGAILTVSGKFTGTILSGNVNFSPSNARRSYEAPLTGFVGQDGAVGIFANSANNSNSDYAFGGGFVVVR